MSNGGPHTNFNSGSFGGVGFGLAAVAASAVVAGVQNLRERRAAEWATWDRGQLLTAVELEHSLRVGAQRERDAEREENARLRRVVAALTVRRPR